MLRDKTPLSRSVAAQVAQLLNKHNNLAGKYHEFSILNSKAVYLPLHISGIVLGNVAVDRLNFFLSEIKHLVVHPEVRGFSIGHTLIKIALENVTTPLAFATIREDNAASRALFEKSNFERVAKAELIDHNVLMYFKEEMKLIGPGSTKKVKTAGYVIGQIQNLVNPVKSYCFFKKNLGDRVYEVKWVSESKTCLVNLGSYDILDLKLMYSDGTEEFHKFNPALDYVRSLKVLNSLLAELNDFKDAGYDNFNKSYITRSAYKEETEPPLNEICSQITSRFCDPYNAVLITADSWLDKKLQEMYYSKRGTLEEQKDNGQHSNS